MPGLGLILLMVLMTTVSVALKLTGLVVWGWWWVLSPVWMSLSALILIILIGLAVEFIHDFVARFWR